MSVGHVELESRYAGSLLGLACGDALGTTLEFASPGSFEPIFEIRGGGPFQLPPGYWTDDTSMAMCLAESLVERGGFDAADQMLRYVRWWKEGHWSSTGRCFDIGTITAMALARFVETGEPMSGGREPDKAGNGSLMRLAPVILYYAADASEAIRMAGESSRTTHGARVCIDCCRYMAGLLAGALAGASKEELCSPKFTPWPGLWKREPLHKEVEEVAMGSFRRRSPPHIKGSGFVVRSMEAALWAFFHGRSFENGALKAVNLGDDADTTGAIYGQLAGAYHGEDAIPERWRKMLHRGGEIRAMGVRLLRASMERRAGV
jgi:ADP-ribosylglycohydrolase